MANGLRGRLWQVPLYGTLLLTYAYAPTRLPALMSLDALAESLSDHIMYLVIKCKVTVGSEGRFVVSRCIGKVLDLLGYCTDRMEFLHSRRCVTTLLSTDTFS